MGTRTLPARLLAPARPMRAFLVFALCVLSALTAWGIVNQRVSMDSARLVLLLALGGSHGLLHFRFERLAKRRPAALPVYFATQAAIAAAIGALSGSPLVTLALSLTLLGEAVSALTRARAAVAGALFLVVPALHAVVQGGLSPHSWLVGIGSTLFVVFYVEMFQQQASLRSRAEAALSDLDAAHRELESYAERVQELTLASERQRMARELHDTLAQGLAGLILQMEALRAPIEGGDRMKAQAVLDRAREHARAALAEARQAIGDLRAAGSAPLAEGIRAEVLRFEQATGIRCELEIADALPLSDDDASHALRCVSEGLTNCTRHARARSARVSATRQGSRVVVEIADDGVGFDPIAAATRADHYGLLGLRERARLAGGALAVESEPGRGTRIRLELPAHEADRG
jgi:NarL family two-component system sensor histidine kinase YdfH